MVVSAFTAVGVARRRKVCYQTTRRQGRENVDESAHLSKESNAVIVSYSSSFGNMWQYATCVLYSATRHLPRVQSCRPSDWCQPKVEPWAFAATSRGSL